MSYRPSGDVEAVLSEIASARLEGRPHLSTGATRALIAIPDDGQSLAPGQVAESATLDGDDPAAMEHEAERQAWLARVQRVNWR